MEQDVISHNTKDMERILEWELAECAYSLLKDLGPHHYETVFQPLISFTFREGYESEFRKVFQLPQRVDADGLHLRKSNADGEIGIANGVLLFLRGSGTGIAIRRSDSGVFL